MEALCIVGGLVLVGTVLSFILSWRGQTLAHKENERLYKGHEEIIEYLVVAANPEAWVAKQADKAREARRAREVEAVEDDTEVEGVF